jgi:hypothetical protein
MIAHTIVYIVLSVLSLVAAYAVGTPLNEPPQEQHKPGDIADKDNDSL